MNTLTWTLSGGVLVAGVTLLLLSRSESPSSDTIAAGAPLDRLTETSLQESDAEAQVAQKNTTRPRLPPPRRDAPPQLAAAARETDANAEALALVRSGAANQSAPSFERTLEQEQAWARFGNVMYETIGDNSLALKYMQLIDDACGELHQSGSDIPLVQGMLQDIMGKMVMGQIELLDQDMFLATNQARQTMPGTYEFSCYGDLDFVKSADIREQALAEGAFSAE